MTREKILVYFILVLLLGKERESGRRKKVERQDRAAREPGLCSRREVMCY